MLLCCLLVTTASGYVRAEESRTAATRVDEGKLIKQAVVSYVSVSAKLEELQRESALQSDIVDLLTIFDSLDTEADLKTLGSLSSYYIGSHGSELFRCLVLRKGPRIEPRLREMLNEAKSECRELLGDTRKVCYSAQELSDKLRTLLKEIGEGRKCSLEEVLE
jgi:hypothetical protein